jgi:hypothetical protein
MIHFPVVVCTRSPSTQLVDLAARRLAALFADRPPHRGQEAQLGVDGVAVAHTAELKPRTADSPPPAKIYGSFSFAGWRCARSLGR